MNGLQEESYGGNSSHRHFAMTKKELPDNPLRELSEWPQ